MKKEYLKKYKIGVVFVGMLCVGLFLQIFNFNKTFSEEENRVLEKIPSYQFSDWMNGGYQEQLDAYINDHFFLRTSWMRAKTSVEKTMGVKKIKDVYIGDNQQLLQEFMEPKAHVLENKANRINSFLTTYPQIETSMLIIPNSINVYADSLASQAPIADQNKTMDAFYQLINDACKKVDVRDTFKEHKREYLYYKSDHHWTTLGAKYAFDAWISNTSLENKQIAYETIVANDGFQGTLDKKIAYYENVDNITIYKPVEDTTKQIVTYVDSNTQSTSLYKKENQFSYDPYTLFLDGNHPLVEIATTSTNNRRLLVFKDSYANCFVPFLTPYYHDITIVDPRYYYDDIHALIQEKEITDIVFLYNANTFFSDTSLEDLLSE